MLRLVRLGAIAAVILGVVHGVSIRDVGEDLILAEAELETLPVDGTLDTIIEEVPDEDFSILPFEVDGTSDTIIEEVTDEPLPVALGGEEETITELISEEEPVGVLEVPEEAVLEEAVPEEAVLEEVVAVVADVEPEAPAGIETIVSAEAAPVGVLTIPDDVPVPEEELIFEAASVGEEASGIVVSNGRRYDTTGCPAGYGKPLNEPTVSCAKPRGNVDGYAYIDDNRNLNKEAEEIGLPGILLTISNKAATFRASVRTDSTGRYQIKNLPPGTYIITLDISTSPAGVTAVHDQVTIAVQPFTNVSQDFPFQGAAPPTVLASGIIGPAHVFIDVNGNGVFDGADTAVSGVLIKLTSHTANPFTPAVLTDLRGEYQFTDLERGMYTVSLDTATIPSGTTPDRTSYTVTLDENEQFVNGAFPLRPPQPTSSIGPNYVFVDTVKNSVMDYTEKGMSGVLVRLINSNGALAATTLTDSNGAFSFSQQHAGTYLIQIDLATIPALYVSVRPEGKMTVTLLQGQNNRNANFPVLAPSTGNVGISKVYGDLNLNAVHDVGEPGIPNVLVNLVDSLGKVVSSSRSDSNGNFQFTNVLVGLYRVEVVTSSVVDKYHLDAPNPPNVAVTEGATSNGITIRALMRYAQIGPAAAFVDDNGNNVQDSAEAGVPGVTVMLIQQGKVVQSTKTDLSGRYSFTSLQPGTFLVRIDRATVPFGLATVKTDGEYSISLTPSQTATGSMVNIPFKKLVLSRIRGTVTNNGTPIPGVKVSCLDNGGGLLSDMFTDDKGVFAVTNLPAGTYNLQIDPQTIPTGLIPADKKTGKVAVTVRWGDSLTVNFKYKSAYGTIGPGTLFVDTNGNELHDSGEPGLAGITVDLMQTNGKVVSTTKTDSNGRYQFNHVAPASYEVRIIASTLPAQYVINRVSYALRLKAAQQFTGVPANFAVRTAGVVPTTTPTPGVSAVTGYVYYDLNNSGARDIGENGIAGAIVRVVGGNLLLAQATTDSVGKYTITNAPVGSYDLLLDVATLPSTVTCSTPRKSVTLLSGQTFTSSVASFAVRDTTTTVVSSIVGAVYGALGAALPGVVVNLLNASNQFISAATTASNGQFSFPSLLTGVYTVSVNTATLPSNMEQTSDSDGVLDSKTTLTLTSSASATAIFRYKSTSSSSTASIGPGSVFFDGNQNKIKDRLEQGTAGVTLQLLSSLLSSSSMVLQTAQTDASGVYSFKDVSPGTYYVKVDTSTLPLNTQATRTDFQVTVAKGEVFTACEVPLQFIPAQISGMVFNDKSQYGTLDSSDAGLATTLSLYDSTGTNFYLSAVSDSRGNFVLNNIAPGNYLAKVSRPTGMVQSYGPSGGTMDQAPITVTSGATITSINFGYMYPT